MLREAEKQFLSALKTADMVTTVLELSKVLLGSHAIGHKSGPLCLSIFP